MINRNNYLPIIAGAWPHRAPWGNPTNSASTTAKTSRMSFLPCSAEAATRHLPTASNEYRKSRPKMEPRWVSAMSNGPGARLLRLDRTQTQIVRPQFCKPEGIGGSVLALSVHIRDTTW